MTVTDADLAQITADSTPEEDAAIFRKAELDPVEEEKLVARLREAKGIAPGEAYAFVGTAQDARPL